MIKWGPSDECTCTPKLKFSNSHILDILLKFTLLTYLVTGLISHGIAGLSGALLRLHRAGGWASFAGVVDADGGDALERRVGAESLRRRILRLLRNIPFSEFRCGNDHVSVYNFFGDTSIDTAL